VLHVGVVLAVVLQVGFAAAFLVDARQTNRTYDALAAHHVTITATVLGCAFAGRNRFGGYTGHICRVGYDYQGQHFTAYIPFGQTPTFYIDPRDTSLRMSRVSFEKGPEETIGDIAIAAVLVVGAVAVTVFHLVHTHRRSRRRAGSKPSR
jgi:hypothetical protein